MKSEASGSIEMKESFQSRIVQTPCKFATVLEGFVCLSIMIWSDLSSLREKPTFFRFICLEAYFSGVVVKSSLPKTDIEGI